MRKGIVLAVMMAFTFGAVGGSDIACALGKCNELPRAECLKCAKKRGYSDSQASGYCR